MRLSRIRKQILDERDIVIVSLAKGIQRRLKQIPETPVSNLKTAHMKWLELKFGLPIEYLLVGAGYRRLAARLGVTISCICRWRKRLGLNWSPDRLPKCEGCPEAKMACLYGDCQILLGENQLDLAALKRQEILAERQVTPGEGNS